MTRMLNSSLRILLIEDDDDDVVITKALLGEGLRLPWVLELCVDFDSGLDAIRTGEFDIALVDLCLGPESGLDLIHQARKSGVTTPAILLTGQGDDSNDLNAVEMGASDYLVKGIVESATMARSIRYAIERTQSSIHVAQSEARYRVLFEANPEPLCLAASETGRIIALNRAAADLYGLDRSTVTELTLQQLRASPEVEAAMLAEPTTRDYQPQTGATLELHCGKNGKQLHVEVTRNLVRTEQGDSCLVMFSNVSSRIAALQYARSSEQAYLNLLTDLRDAVLVVDRERRIHYANPAATELLESSGRDFQQLPPDFPPPDQRKLSVWSLSTRPDWAIWVEVQSTPTRWQGEPMSLMTMRDISQRIRAEERLRLMDRSIEASSNGILIADAKAPDLPIIYANSSFERMTGYSREEILGRNCRFLQGPDTEENRRLEIRKAIEEKREVRVILKNYRKDGSPFWNDVYIAPVPDENGQISHFIGVQNDISDRKNAESEIAYNASHDVLTGLPNRSLLEDRLRQGVQVAERHNRTLAVLFVNLDGFKPVNDSLGHPVGDQVLIQAAQRLQQSIRAGDTVARIGGDEFVVLLPDLALPEDVVKVAENLLHEISRPYDVHGHSLHLTASMGITINDGLIENPMGLVQQADMAMMEAKQKGKNTYQWFTSELNQLANNRVVLRNELEKAIELDRLTLHYQPLIDTQTGKIVASEALVRWLDPERGIIPPGDFIPIAEETGQIIRLGRWVLEQACRDNKALIDSGYSDHVVTVNVSPLQLQQSGFVALVKNVLEGSGLPPQKLVLEVTESALLGNRDQAINSMEELNAMGVGIAIDDFGTGFSSLNYLKMLPATRLKIDRSFINEVISDRKDASITQGIISMAHHLGLVVVAEGVETEAQASFLRKNHCDVFQGFLFSRPVPLKELDGLLRADPFRRGGTDASQRQRTLLILDDEQNILRALTRLLRRDGYRILSTSDAKEAFKLLAENDVQVIISDQRMPEISGTEFLSQVKDIYPDTIRIVLSGYTDFTSITGAINEGAIYKFLTKPWDDEQIRNNIRQAFMHYAAGKTEDVSNGE